MVLSIIIVNYNVKHFLELCLCSVKKALDLSAALNNRVTPFAEVLVIDNNSTDGSIEYLEPRFPFAQFLANSENIGFSKANNQALELVKGRYVLFLNPDTILPEDIFQKTIAFMEARPDAGMLGVHMVDGTG
ncbi:MAG TPA: glycosyltransferase, partial [Chitinophagaceae bacterium]|nr:glycosyltransferase [Chitinophagaceae bacterium]